MTTTKNARRLKIVYRPIDALKPYDKNSRTHTDEQIDQLVASMDEWDWTNPILVTPDDRIIAGHARHQAARRKGFTEVPTIPIDDLTEEQIRAYVIADNKLAENAGWDMDLLASEVQALNAEGYELGLMGFDQGELTRLLATNLEEGLTDPDDCPDADPERIVSMLGDVWVMGNHRLVNGDCTSKEVVDLALNGVVPNLMVTDPPYGVNYNPSWRKDSGLAKNGQIAEGKVMNDDRADWREAWELFPGLVAYVWHAGTKAHIVAESLEAMGLEIRSQIVWVKNRFAISRGHYHVQHEPAFEARRDEDNEYAHETAQYAVRKGNSASWDGGRKQSTVWFIEHKKNDTGHGTQKPVECMERPIRNNSSPGQAVYEPFNGSGTTLIACQKTGRSCIAIELDPVYCDMTVRRWQDYSGRDAVLEATGQSFTEVMAERISAGDLDSAPDSAPDSDLDSAPVEEPTAEDLEDAGLAESATPERFVPYFDPGQRKVWVVLDREADPEKSEVFTTPGYGETNKKLAQAKAAALNGQAAGAKAAAQLEGGES